VALRRPAAAPSQLTIGLQLSSVGGELRQDLPRTLDRIAAAGFREVELSAELRKLRAQEIRKALDGAGLRCHSAHWDLWDDAEETGTAIDAATELGISYLVTPFPALMTADGLQPVAGTDSDLRMLTSKMTLNDWRWNIDWFNHIGGIAQKFGIQFVYHNHQMEFRRFGDIVVLEDILARTDSGRVKLQLNCPSAAAAGYDPIAFIRRHADRIAMLHVPASDAVRWRLTVAAARDYGISGVYIAEPSPLAALQTARELLTP